MKYEEEERQQTRGRRRDETCATDKRKGYQKKKDSQGIGDIKARCQRKKSQKKI
jgi:hypothetical protein